MIHKHQANLEKLELKAEREKNYNLRYNIETKKENIILVDKHKNVIIQNADENESTKKNASSNRGKTLKK